MSDHFFFGTSFYRKDSNSYNQVQHNTLNRRAAHAGAYAVPSWMKHGMDNPPPKQQMSEPIEEPTREESMPDDYVQKTEGAWSTPM
tara:strand:+ start:439 stop:696 length:258 start_codon:yes stop_codon:yes gene_type:complete